MAYKYKRPEGKLYKVSLRKWEKTFAKRGKWPFEIAEVYVRGDKAVVQYVIGKFGKLFLVFSTPVVYIIGTLAIGFPETHKEIKDLWWQKSTGSFSSDVIYKDRGDGWYKLMEVIK